MYTDTNSLFRKTRERNSLEVALKLRRNHRNNEGNRSTSSKERIGDAFCRYPISSTLLTKCTIEGCGMAYDQKSKFRAHLRTHIGLKPFICQACGKAFNYKWNLKSHALLHGDDTPYKCYVNDCKQAYKSSGELKLHLIRHSNSCNNFYCPYCDNQFTRYKSAIMHIKDSHFVTLKNDKQIFQIIKDVKNKKLQSLPSISHKEQLLSKSEEAIHKGNCNDFSNIGLSSDFSQLLINGFNHPFEHLAQNNSEFNNEILPINQLYTEEDLLPLKELMEIILPCIRLVPSPSSTYLKKINNK